MNITKVSDVLSEENIDLTMYSWIEKSKTIGSYYKDPYLYQSVTEYENDKYEQQ